MAGQASAAMAASAARRPLQPTGGPRHPSPGRQGRQRPVPGLYGLVISHKSNGVRCAGSVQEAAEPAPVASWLPLRPGLTPHGLRRGHETWLDDLGIRYVLQSERMGHEVPGMRGVYSHITPGMRENLVAGLQELWEASLRERARTSATSPVQALDSLLASFRGRQPRSAPVLLPKSDT